VKNDFGKGEKKKNSADVNEQPKLRRGSPHPHQWQSQRISVVRTNKMAEMFMWKQPDDRTCPCGRNCDGKAKTRTQTQQEKNDLNFP